MELQRMNRQPPKSDPVANCINICVLTFFWYKFASLQFANPDGECYADTKNHKAVDLLGSNSSMTDVGGQMKSWIFYGLLLYSLAPVFVFVRIFVIERPPDKDGKTFMDGPATIWHFLLIGLMLFQMIMGLYLPIWGWFVRFDEAGKLCSGDYYEGHDEDPKPYMWETSNWMWWYVIFWMTSIFILITGCCCLIVLAFSIRQEGANRPIR